MHGNHVGRDSVADSMQGFKDKITAQNLIIDELKKELFWLTREFNQKRAAIDNLASGYTDVAELIKHLAWGIKTANEHQNLNSFKLEK